MLFKLYTLFIRSKILTYRLTEVVEDAIKEERSMI